VTSAKFSMGLQNDFALEKPERKMTQDMHRRPKLN